ncbi:MAG: HesA/MoeB/ThiF family protein [Candidatus Bathyarchaeota archaeon]|nr:MAG: HesA/MoeB/ThiF family protein [Candidatus Bathyarchaeota archaeon]
MDNPPTFNPDEFYSRQTVLRELGPTGQRNLRDARVVVVGLGGLGSISTLYLALAGVGYLRLIDQDTVELHNLHRQVLYTMENLRYPKAEIAAQTIRKVNPDVEIDPIPRNVRASNIDELVNDVDCIVDGLDNMQTRYLLNRASIKREIPYVFGGALGFEGNLSVFAPPETPCLECILPGIDDNHLPTCDTRGVMGATAGIIGTMQAMETIKLLTGMDETLKGKLLICDFKTMYFSAIDIFKSPKCPACQGIAKKPDKAAERLAWLCGRDTVNVNPPKPLRIKLDKAHKALKGEFRMLVKSPYVVIFQYDRDIEVSLFSSGRMLMKHVKDEASALNVFNKIIKKLGMNAGSFGL